MLHSIMMMAPSPACLAVRKTSSPPPPRKGQRQKPATKTSHGFGRQKKSPVWQCVEKCGACCKLDKGPTFPSPEEIFDNPSDVEIVRTFAELSQRFLILYMLSMVVDSFFRESINAHLAFSCCADTIKTVYGANSQELEKFNNAIWSSSPK
ncbi:hypothetical protein SASPL_135955 [Salvia splendens]|uniref:Uncharacterized protein n=1 Tax=Salvia splendens TaxID=180675 RepID=A0A8X8ZG79_SALSN|nr:hypothetical protein SASPL_135955 [Salvia splendens]